MALVAAAYNFFLAGVVWVSDWSFVKLLCLLLLSASLVSCAAIEEENNSPTPIPPPRADPFGGGIGSSAPPAETGAGMSVGR